MSARNAVLNEGFLELLADALSSDQGHIQGFLYGGHHVIRDVSKLWAEQELWRLRQKTESDYDACHQKMMRQIEVFRLRKAVTRALATVDAPWPGQEEAAESARSHFGEPPSPGTRMPRPTIKRMGVGHERRRERAALLDHSSPAPRRRHLQMVRADARPSRQGTAMRAHAAAARSVPDLEHGAEAMTLPSPQAGDGPVETNAKADALKRVLKTWHENTCYPTASDDELSLGAYAVFTALADTAPALAAPAAVAVPEEVRELLARTYSTERQRAIVSEMVTNSDDGETIARVVTDAKVLHEIKAILATPPSGRAAEGGEAVTYEMDQDGAWTWLVWAISPAGPHLAAIARSEAKAEGYRDATVRLYPGARVHIERAPVDHTFGASDLRSVAYRAAMKDARRRGLPGFAAAPTPEPAEGGEPMWHQPDKEQEVGRRYVQLSDDGSCAYLRVRYDGGILDCEGSETFDHPEYPPGPWAYLPAGYRLWCEDHGDDPVTLPTPADAEAREGR